MTIIADNVVWQLPGEGLAGLLSGLSGTHGRSSKYLAHVVNLYRPKSEPTLGSVQNATISSMRAARYALGNNLLDDCPPEVRFVSVHAGADEDVVPDDFDPAPHLERSVAALAIPGLTLSLPFVFDILSNGCKAAGSAEFIVYTNSDICLTPWFYASVGILLQRGGDAIIINRRTVNGFDPISSPLVLAASDLGETHPGLDCFVVPTHLIPVFTPSAACVGAGFVMRSLLLNLVAHCNRLLVLTEAHLTFHYGDDRRWAQPSMRKYEDHNRNETEGVYADLARDPLRRRRLHAFFDALPKYQPQAARSAPR